MFCIVSKCYIYRNFLNNIFYSYVYIAPFFTANVSYKFYDYYISHKNVSIPWEQAEKECQQMQGNLTSIRSEDELEFLKKFT